MKKRRIAAFAAACVLSASALAGCAGGQGSETPQSGSTSSAPAESGSAAADSGVAKTGFPIVEEPVTITIFCSKPSGTPNDFNEIPFYQRYAEQTNVNINWQLADSDAFNEKLNVIIATEDLPDAVMKGYISDVEVSKQVKYGTYMDVAPMLADYAPNLNGYLEADPSLRKGLTIEGGIYGLPYICESDSIRTRKAYVNTKWLEAVGAKMPATTDELLEVLRLFRDKDPNGNGEQDEIPFGTESVSNVKSAFFGAFGLQNRGMPNGSNYIDEDPDNAGHVRFFRAAEGMKEVLAYCKTLYDEKLIDPNIFSIKSTDFYAYAAQNKVGFHVTLPPLIGPAYCDDFIGLDAPLKGPQGDQICPVLGKLFTKNCLLITKVNPYPEATLRWADYFYSDEGSIDFFLGEEGVTYEKTADGNYEYTDFVNHNPDGKSVDDVIAQYSIYPGGANPAVLTDKNFKGAEMYKTSYEATERFLKYGPDPLWEEFVFTPDEASEISSIKTELTTMLTENEAKFINGERSFDEWDKYVQELKGAGMDRYLELYQQAYERYAA